MTYINGSEIVKNLPSVIAGSGKRAVHKEGDISPFDIKRGYQLYDHIDDIAWQNGEISPTVRVLEKKNGNRIVKYVVNTVLTDNKGGKKPAVLVYHITKPKFGILGWFLERLDMAKDRWDKPYFKCLLNPSPNGAEGIYYGSMDKDVAGIVKDGSQKLILNNNKTYKQGARDATEFVETNLRFEYLRKFFRHNTKLQKYNFLKHMFGLKFRI